MARIEPGRRTHFNNNPKEDWRQTINTLKRPFYFSLSIGDLVMVAHGLLGVALLFCTIIQGLLRIGLCKW